jgi:hypothetical protein
MGSISDYLEDALLDHIFNGAGVAYTPATTLYVGLSTADPLDTAAGIAEPSGNGYARVAVTPATGFSAAASRAVVQNGVITFPQASGAWGTITHWFICDHATNTSFGTDVELLAHGSLSVSKVIVNGNTPSIATTEINISFKTLASKGTGENISDYLANAILDFAFRNQSFTQPATYIAYATADLTDANTGATMTECADANAYARKQVNDNGGSSPTWDLVSTQLIDNTHDIVQASPTGSWGLITAMAILDGGTHGAGNVLFYDNGLTEQTPDNGDTVQIDAGACDIALT